MNKSAKTVLVAPKQVNRQYASFNCSVVDNKQIDIRSETTKNVGLTPPDRQITRSTEEQFPPRTSTTINVTLTQWTFDCHPRGPLCLFVLPHSTATWQTSHVYVRLVPAHVDNLIPYINTHYLLWPLCLQCFDAVGWAAGRASGL